MAVAFAMLYGGSEEYVLRAPSRASLERVILSNEWREHPRLRRIVLTSPDGTEEILHGKDVSARKLTTRSPDAALADLTTSRSRETRTR